MKRSSFHRILTGLLLVGLFCGLLPGAALRAAAPAAASEGPPSSEPPLTVPPVIDPHLPSLTLQLTIAPDPITVGDTLPFTLSGANQASDPADALVVSVPLPDNAEALPSPNLISAPPGWQWNIGQLAGRTSTTLSGALRLLRPPSGDAVGNVKTITDNTTTPIPAQSFGYGARDRLTSWTSGGTTQSYGYDALGNLTNKAGVAYSYGTQSMSCPNGALRKPHAAVTVGGTSYCYDPNGDLVSGGGRTYDWNAENQLASVSQTSGSESYRYNGTANGCSSHAAARRRPIWPGCGKRSWGER
jgi:YD repeat-containing protein